MKRLTAQPLVQFLLIGAVLFGIRWMVSDRAGAPDQIRITPLVVEQLLAGFRATWRRPPTEAEMQGLLEGYLRDEVLYREALSLGLDQDDQVVRRRMRQKLELMTAGIVESIQPTEAELRRYLNENPDRYRREATISFVHVYLRSDDDPQQASQRAGSLLAQLRNVPAADPGTLGDPFLHPPAFANASERQVSGMFGEAFADRLAGLPVGEWTGPVESPYGLHLVRVDALTPARLSRFEEVREAVARDFVSARTRDASDAYFEGLLARYEVTVEWPEGMAPVDLPGLER